MAAKWVLTNLVTLCIVLFLNCSESTTSPSSGSVVNKQLTLSLALPDDAPDSLSKAIAIITAPGGGTITRQLIIEDKKVFGTISNLPVAYNYYIEINILNAEGLIIYNGDTSFDIVSDQSIEVTIKLKPVSGSIDVNGVVIAKDSLDTIEYNVTGCWNIKQLNGNSGSLQLVQEGITVMGISKWTTHSNGPIVGTLAGTRLSITITYPEEVIGYYFANITCDTTLNGLSISSTGDTVNWSATRIECDPLPITGCWSVTQSNSEMGFLEFVQEGTTITGVSHWITHSNGPIAGTLTDNKLSFTINYPENVIGYYYATYKGSENELINGTTQSSTGGSAQWNSKRISCTSN